MADVIQSPGTPKENLPNIIINPIQIAPDKEFKTDTVFDRLGEWKDDGGPIKCSWYISHYWTCPKCSRINLEIHLNKTINAIECMYCRHEGGVFDPREFVPEGLKVIDSILKKAARHGHLKKIIIPAINKGCEISDTPKRLVSPDGRTI